MSTISLMTNDNEVIYIDKRYFKYFKIFEEFNDDGVEDIKYVFDISYSDMKTMIDYCRVYKIKIPVERTIRIIKISNPIKLLGYSRLMGCNILHEFIIKNYNFKNN